MLLAFWDGQGQEYSVQCGQYIVFKYHGYKPRPFENNISGNEKAYNAYCSVYITKLSIQNYFVDLFLSFGLSELNWEVAAEIIFIFLVLILPHNCKNTYQTITYRQLGIIKL